MKRAKDVMERLLNGSMEHCDLALFTLQMNATKNHKKMPIKRRDYADVRDRLKIVHPAGAKIPHATIGDLPEPLASFLGAGGMVWKIEWMYEGDYLVEESEEYKNRYKYNRQGCKNLYSKLVDMMGFAKWDMSLKMWIETLFRPNQVVSYEGKAFRHDIRVVQLQTAKMMSVVLDYKHVITATLIQ